MEKQIDKRFIDRLVKISEDASDAEDNSDTKAFEEAEESAKKLWVEIQRHGQSLGLSEDKVSAQVNARVDKIFEDQYEKEVARKEQEIQKKHNPNRQKRKKSKRFDWSVDNHNVMLLGSLIAGLLVSVPIYIGYRYATAPKASVRASMEEADRKRMKDHRMKERRLVGRADHFYDIAAEAIEVSREESVAVYDKFLPVDVSKRDVLYSEIHVSQDNSWNEFMASGLWSDMEIVIDSDVYRDKLVNVEDKRFDVRLFKVLAKGMLDYMNESRGLSKSDVVTLDWDNDGLSVEDDDKEGRAFVIGISSVYDAAYDNIKEDVCNDVYWQKVLKDIYGSYKIELRVNADRYLKEQEDNNDKNLGATKVPRVDSGIRGVSEKPVIS